AMRRSSAPTTTRSTTAGSSRAAASSSTPATPAPAAALSPRMSSKPEPPRRRVLILVNPAAGRARSGRVGRVAAALERRGVAVTIRTGEPPQGVEQLAREAEPEFDPLGAANVLARGLGLPRRAAALAEIIATAPARDFWPGRIGDRLFVAMASSG